MPNGFQYVYDPRSRRYRNISNGQYVTSKELRGAVDTIIDGETVKIRDISQRLIDGEITLADWQGQVASMLKTLHVTMGVAAVGGFDSASQADFGYMGSLIKKQYHYLAKFAQDIASGKQALDGTLLSRSALYTQASRSIFEDVVGKTAEAGGATQEKSELGVADHCPECVDEASKGWSPIGTLIPIGERLCKANCRCQMIYK